MDPNTRTIRLAAFLMSRGLPVGDLGTGLDDRVLQALSAAPAFGRAEVEACLALGDPAIPVLLERLAPAARAPGTPATHSPPSAPEPQWVADLPSPDGAPETASDFDPEIKAEITNLLAKNAKFKTQLTGLPARVGDNDPAYAQMLITHYSSRDSKETLGTRAAVLLARFVELWMAPDLRPVARAEYSLATLFGPGEMP